MLKKFVPIIFLFFSLHAHANIIQMTCKFFVVDPKYKGPTEAIQLILEVGLIKDKIVWANKELEDSKFDKKSDTWTATSQNKGVKFVFLNDTKVLSLKNEISGANLNFKCH
jgi:hypothetical protein